MQLQRVQASGVNSVQRDGVVRNGERLRIVIETTAPAYTYVMLKTSKGRIDSLHPWSKEETLLPKRALVIPGEGKSMEVLGDVGAQQIVVLAASHSLCKASPVPDVLASMCQTLVAPETPLGTDLRRRGSETDEWQAEEKEKEPERKPPIKITDRGGSFVEQGRNVQSMKAGINGVAELTFSIRVEL